VAMARAVVRQPAAFLLDEPLSNLDAHLRASMRDEIRQLTRSLRVTTLYVTHDQLEALTLADRVAVLRRGHLQQVGTPDEVYADPATLFVAAFVGVGQMNLLQAAVYAQESGAVVVDFGAQVLRIPATHPRAAALTPHHTARVTVGIRGDFLSLADGPGTDDLLRGNDLLRGVVRYVENLGHDVIVHVETGAVPVAPAATQLDGDLRGLEPDPRDDRGTLRRALARMVPQSYTEREAPPRYAFHSRYEPEEEPEPLGDVVLRLPHHVAPRRGDQVALRVDLGRIFLFDRSGSRIRLPDVSLP
jgi:multiple sugar transport system ATP-binding protein